MLLMRMSLRGLGQLACALLLFSNSAWAENPAKLQVSPDRCISLHQNQMCYQVVTFSWSLPTVGNYCLFEEHKAAPILCWQDAGRSSFKYDFQSDHAIEYEIRRPGAQEVLARVRVRVASVYSSPRKSVSGWRLF